MKVLKVLVLLMVLATLFLVVMPVSADQPGTAEDPFGGPYSTTTSGDGTKPTKAINLGFKTAGGTTNANCSTLVIPAGTARWFKAQSRAGYRLNVWVDEELAGAKAPSGYDVGGMAYGYFYGSQGKLQPNEGKFTGYSQGGNDYGMNIIQGANPAGPEFWNVFDNGIWMKVYDPNSVEGETFLWPIPKATWEDPNPRRPWRLLTTNDGIEANGIPVPFHQWANTNGTQLRGVSGWPLHLLWTSNVWGKSLQAGTEGKLGGSGAVWSVYKVYNVMVWDATVSVCAQLQANP